MKNTKKLAAIKKKIGMTNSAIGAKVGVDQSTVYRIFDGQIASWRRRYALYREDTMIPHPLGQGSYMPTRMLNIVLAC